MAKSIAIIQGHPDTTSPHLCHALAQAYAQAAIIGGHSVTQIDVGSISFQPLRSAAEYEQCDVAPDIARAQDIIRRADHLVFTYPLWMGAMPALLKAFLEQTFRHELIHGDTGPHDPLHSVLRSKSVRIIVTMGMPAAGYRMATATGLSVTDKCMLTCCGLGKIHQTAIGSLGTASASQIRKHIRTVTDLGSRGG